MKKLIRFQVLLTIMSWVCFFTPIYFYVIRGNPMSENSFVIIRFGYFLIIPINAFCVYLGCRMFNSDVSNRFIDSIATIIVVVSGCVCFVSHIASLSSIFIVSLSILPTGSAIIMTRYLVFRKWITINDGVSKRSLSISYLLQFLAMLTPMLWFAIRLCC